MAFAERFRMATDKEKTEAVARLVKASTGDFDFYLLAILGIGMAALGLILNSPEIVIGSMLIAPILYPLLSVSLALVLSDFPLLYRSVRTLATSFIISIGIALGISLFLMPFGTTMSPQVLARAVPSTLYFVVAFISGFAASYALVHANLNEMLPGVAISVSLVPPLAVVGIGIGFLNWAVAAGALVLFVTNVAGIVFASMITFSLMDLHSTRKVADSAIRQEDKRLEEEHEKVQEIIEQDNTMHHA